MNWPTAIVDISDPRVEPYLNIRDRDLGRRKSFIAEGTVVLRKLLQSEHYAPQSALILENRLSGLEDVVAEMQARDIPLYMASRDIMDAITGFPIHRGVLAVGSRRKPASAADMIGQLPESALVVVCIGISNHDNIGAIFRNARGLGAHAVFYDETTCDPLYRKAIRVSVGSVFELPHAPFDDVDELRLKLDQASFRQIALSPSGREELHAIATGPRAALYVGAEGPGLPDSLLSRLETVRIKMQPGFDSLNVATACALALYQLTPEQPS